MLLLADMPRGSIVRKKDDQSVDQTHDTNCVGHRRIGTYVVQGMDYRTKPFDPFGIMMMAIPGWRIRWGRVSRRWHSNNRRVMRLSEREGGGEFNNVEPSCNMPTDIKQTATDLSGQRYVHVAIDRS
jgi:hypothetical protein